MENKIFNEMFPLYEKELAGHRVMVNVIYLFMQLMLWLNSTDGKKLFPLG